MKKASAKIFAVTCALMLGLSIGPSAYSTPQDGELSVAQIELEMTNLAAKSSVAQAELAQARAAEITANAKMIAALDDAINTQKKYEEAISRVNGAKKALGGIAQAMYQDAAGSLTNAYYLFGAENLNEATSRSRAYDRLAGTADAKIGRLKALQTIANSMRQKAEKAAGEQAKQAEAAEAAAGAVEKRAADVESQLNSAKERREVLVQQLAAKRQTDIAAERARAEQMEANRARQAATHAAAVVSKAEAGAVKIANAKIGEKPAEPATPVKPQVAKKKTEEAPAVHQSAAAKKAEEEREKAIREANAKSSAKTNNDEQEKPTGKNSGIGQKIVAFAKQYTGTKYVWGGTSPEDGWDCSGFTGFVFRHFGVKLPRTSGSQYAAFKHREVPASQARPGDLMWWPGHVGIYVGGGKNVAANTPALGTTISSNYGSPRYLRILD